jgi:MYXO-CTERM domain-containing protein
VDQGSTDCTTSCQDCCSGSCTVQANVTCDESCVSDLTGGCTTKCSALTGSLFCDDQYIDIAQVTDCTFALTVNATATVKAGTAKASCTVAAPGTDSPFGFPAGVAAIVGLGLLVVRRRKA